MNNISYILTVKLGPGLWRKLQVDGKMTLHDLHLGIIEAFDFDNDHLYGFFMDNKAWSTNACFWSPYDEELPGSEEHQLQEFNFIKGDKFLYIFDFGDEWRFQITVFKELETTTEKIKVVSTKGESPSQYPDWDDEDYEW